MNNEPLIEIDNTDFRTQLNAKIKVIMELVKENKELKEELSKLKKLYRPPIHPLPGYIEVDKRTIDTTYDNFKFPPEVNC